jgi:hypothetical protein
MLLDLERQLPVVVAQGLGEGELYRRAALRGRRLPGLRRAPGMLHCPLCGASAAAFLPFGLAGRRNARCPTCGSLERHRFLWLYLTQWTRLLRQPARILHTAPEPCLERRLRALPNLRYRSLDLHDPAADLRADLAALPLDDASVDLVLSSHVLEHLPDDRPALGELARVLRRGGHAVIMVPFDPDLPATRESGGAGTPSERLARFGHPYHYRVYGGDLPARLVAEGFAVTAVSAKRLLSPWRRRFFRINDPIVFDCRRL